MTRRRPQAKLGPRAGQGTSNLGETNEDTFEALMDGRLTKSYIEASWKSLCTVSGLEGEEVTFPMLCLATELYRLNRNIEKLIGRRR